MCIYTKVKAPTSGSTHRGAVANFIRQVRIMGYLMTRLGPLCRISFSDRTVSEADPSGNSPGALCRAQSSPFQPSETISRASASLPQWHSVLIELVSIRIHLQIDIVWGDIGSCVIDPDMDLIMIEARSGYFGGCSSHPCWSCRLLPRSE